MDLDLDGEWEFVIPTNSFNSSNSNSKDLSSSFIDPDLFVETDYFKCPQNTTLLITHHHHYHQQKQEQQQQQQEELPDLPVEQVEEEEEPEPVVEEEEEEEPPSPYKETPPFNWLEPDPVVFDRGSPDRYHKEQVMPMHQLKGEDDKDFVSSGFNLWRLGVHGIGAICSFGVATAATLCVFALGTASSSASGRLRPSPNIQFQIYSDDHKVNLPI